MVMKSYYKLEEFWKEFSQSSPYLAYALKNPKEAENISTIIQLKIDEKPYGQPDKGQPVLKEAKTHFGKALIMVLNTLSGGPAT